MFYKTKPIVVSVIRLIDATKDQKLVSEFIASNTELQIDSVGIIYSKESGLFKVTDSDTPFNYEEDFNGLYLAREEERIVLVSEKLLNHYYEKI